MSRELNNGRDESLGASTATPGTGACVTKAAIVWPGTYPPSCPPLVPDFRGGRFYRMVRSVPAGARDFRPIIRDPDLCECHGLSVFDSLSTIRKMAAANRAMRRHRPMQAYISVTDGVVKSTFGGKGHYTWWVPVAVNPCSLSWCEASSEGEK